MAASEKTQLTIIDARGLVLGRMASIVAKRLMKGEKIIIVNAGDAVISGKRLSIVREKEKFLQIGHHRKGPVHPRTPEGIVKKTVKGMLPRKKPCGMDAIKRLRVYSGIPTEFRESKTITLPEVDVSSLKGSYIKVSELAHNLGWKE
ncbi:50S ribosomal protein L13 [Candidatus Bathyarchaeota archaeon]|nr:50S ribosomal protein L13 [Candidatus Bathyarchaeota archaeon]